MSFSRIILLFVKLPVSGQVKTRLARDVGDEKAVAIYRQLVAQVIEQLPPDGFDELRICFDPADQGPAIEAWLRPQLAATGLEEKVKAVFEAQADGDLGDRLSAAFDSAFKACNDDARVVAIGSDCIEIATEDLAHAFEKLNEPESGAVYGPTFDGGYYLVGLSRPQPELFRGIPWSSEKTLGASLAAAAEKNLKVTLLERRHDIDTESDWHRACDQGE